MNTINRAHHLQGTSGYSVVAAVAAIQTLAATAVLVLPVIAPRVAAVLSIDPMVIGYQIGLVYGSAMVGVLMGAWLVRSYGACRTSQLALLCAAGGCSLAAGPSLPVIAGGSVLIGIAYGMLNPAASHLIVRFTSVGRRYLIFSLKQSGVPLGGVIAGLAGPLLLLTAGRRGPLFATGMLALLLAVLLQTVRESWDDDCAVGSPKWAKPLGGIIRVLQSAPVRCLAIAALLLSGIQLCLVGFLVVALVHEIGYSFVGAGAIFSAVLAAGVCGRIACGLVADVLRSGFALLFVLTVSLAGLFYLTSAFGPDSSRLLVVASFLALGFGSMGWNGVMLAEIARLSGARLAADSTSAVLFLTYVGVLTGPATFTALAPELGGVVRGYVILSAASMLASVLVAIAAWRSHSVSREELT